jgi:hypothetical protein
MSTSGKAAGATRRLERIGYGVAALLLLGAMVVVIGRNGGLWVAIGFGIGPDLALIYGASSGLAPGQILPRAVPLYNRLRRRDGFQLRRPASASP